MRAAEQQRLEVLGGIAMANDKRWQWSREAPAQIGEQQARAQAQIAQLLAQLLAQLPAQLPPGRLPARLTEEMLSVAASRDGNINNHGSGLYCTWVAASLREV